MGSIMTRDDAHATIRTVLALPADFALDDEAVPGDVPGWDSVGWINLLLAFEESLATEIPLDRFDRVETVGDFCVVVEGATAQ
jgi:acyl carrier protein